MSCISREQEATQTANSEEVTVPLIKWTGPCINVWWMWYNVIKFQRIIMHEDRTNSISDVIHPTRSCTAMTHSVGITLSRASWFTRLKECSHSNERHTACAQRSDTLSVVSNNLRPLVAWILINVTIPVKALNLITALPQSLREVLDSTSCVACCNENFASGILFQVLGSFSS